MKTKHLQPTLTTFFFLPLLTAARPLPVPEDRYIVSAAEDLAPLGGGYGLTAGMFRDGVETQWQRLGITAAGTAAGYVAGGAFGAAKGLVDKVTREPCTGERIPDSLKVAEGGSMGSMASFLSLTALPNFQDAVIQGLRGAAVGEATTWLLDQAQRAIDPNSGVCHVDSDKANE